MSSFYGAWPALITPATPEGGVELGVLRELVAHLLGKGIGGLYVCGATGEGLLLSPEERRQVADAVLHEVRGRVPVIVHVGAAATRDAVALAGHARDSGAAGTSSVLPFVGSGPQSTYLHYQAIAAAAPELPFFPYLYGGQIDALTLMRELSQRIPNLGGTKYTGPNMFELKQLLDLGAGRQGWTIFSGMDEQCVFAAMSGSPANIGSTLNLMPGVYREMRRLCEAGDLAAARDLQMHANRLTQVLLSFGYAGALREAVRMLGFDCGQPRLPHPPLPAEKRQALREALAAVGLAELAAL